MIISACSLMVLNVIKLKFFPNVRCICWGNNIFDAIGLIPYFFIGAVFTFQCAKRLLNLQISIALISILLLFNIGYIKSEFILMFVLPLFIFSFALVENPIFARVGIKNDYSYGLYLYGFLIQQVVVQFLNQYNLSVNLYFIISLLVTLMFSYISWYLVEKPFHLVGKRLLRERFVS